MDMIGDFITRLRNASLANHEKVDVPASKTRIGIAGILKSEGYIKDFKVVKVTKQGMIRVYLKYDENGKPLISNIKRVSRPGRRVYRGYEDVPQVRSGLGIAILSSNKGIITNNEAKNLKVGGEVLCTVW